MTPYTPRTPGGRKPTPRPTPVTTGSRPPLRDMVKRQMPKRPGQPASGIAPKSNVASPPATATRTGGRRPTTYQDAVKSGQGGILAGIRNRRRQAPSSSRTPDKQQDVPRGPGRGNSPVYQAVRGIMRRPTTGLKQK